MGTESKEDECGKRKRREEESESGAISNTLICFNQPITYRNISATIEWSQQQNI